MANNVLKVNGIAIADIAKINGETDDDIAKLNGEEFAGVTDAHTLISTHTASARATLDITSGIDSTYDVYEFIYTNIHPATDDTHFQFQVETGSDSDYNHPMITTYFQAYNAESGGTPTLAYSGGNDQATSGDGNGVFQNIAKEMGGGSGNDDEAASGILTLYDPSNTTYVKHFTSTSNCYQGGNTSMQALVAGYINTTTAITRVRFKMSSGNIDEGVIKMYGLAKS